MQATSFRAGESSEEDRCKPPPRPANPCNTSLSSGRGASGLCKTGVRPGSGKEGAKVQKRAPPAQARGQKSAAPRASPPDGGCSGLLDAAALAKGSPGAQSPSRLSGRRRGRAAARGAAATVACALGAGAPTHPGRPPPPPPPRPPPRRSIPAAGGL